MPSNTITVTQMKNHPTPWRVEYHQRFEEWHPKSQPRVVDAGGNTVCEIPQNTNHPGEYDIVTDLAAIAIADCVNDAAIAERCPECGYTRRDCEIHEDHHKCGRFPFFSWEFYV